MIDWHSHILPGIDDGSKDTNESTAMLQMLSQQGIDTVVATPHFFANDESVTDFLKRRQKAYEELACTLGTGLPSILLGAEVRYYPGIGKLSDINRLCIENSSLLLLEMPMEKWTEYTLKELVDIASARNVKLILAHVERYFSLQAPAVWDRLRDAGIILQVNASFFLEFGTKRKALSLLKSAGIHLVGSDCHSQKHRPPKLGDAYEIIRKKLGDEFTDQFNEYGYSLLGQK